MLIVILHHVIRQTETISLFLITQLLISFNSQILVKIYLKKLFYSALLIRESGVSLREHKKWNTQRPECLTLEENTAVTLEATVVAHIAFLSGLLLCLAVFLLEIIIYKNTMK